MKSIISITIFILATGIYGKGQTNFKTNEMTDLRDGTTYPTVEIGNTIWIAENLKYKTENAYHPKNADIGVKLNGLYYPYEEADEVCPKEFRIPTVAEWEAYVDVLLEIKNISNDSVNSFFVKKVDATGREDYSNKIQFFKEPNPLNLNESGWIQGNKVKPMASFNAWIRKEKSPDLKYHIHVLPNAYSKHTHKHHIDTKKRKKRRFVVRCVKNKV